MLQVGNSLSQMKRFFQKGTSYFIIGGNNFNIPFNDITSINLCGEIFITVNLNSGILVYLYSFTLY